MTGTYRRSAAQRRGVGFTLIELLVVVAIIAILISVLLPALTGARRGARAAKCAANLHSVAQAFATYLTENGATYPTAYGYPLDGQGAMDYTNQPSSHPDGYVHWSWFLFQNGAVKPDVFTCPEMPNGGLPRTNPGPERGDREPGQEDQNTNIEPAALTDKQAPRMAFTANAAIVPRNKFTTELSQGVRRNKWVRESEIRESRGVVLATEFAKNWQAVTGVDNPATCKSHRPVSAFYSELSGASEYTAPAPGLFQYGQPGARDYGLAPQAQFETMAGLIDGTYGPEINAVGRHHPGGDKWGGTVNFMLTDGSVKRSTIFQTMKQREWGSKYYSLTTIDPDDTNVRFME